MEEKICLRFYKFDELSVPIWDVVRYYYIGKGRYASNPEEFLFSFDRVKIYDYAKDYPHNLTKEEQELFKKYAHEIDCARSYKRKNKYKDNKDKLYIEFHEIEGTDEVFMGDEFTFDSDGTCGVEYGQSFFTFDKKIIYNFWPERSEKYSTLTEEQRRLMFKYISPFESESEKYK